MNDEARRGTLRWWLVAALAAAIGLVVAVTAFSASSNGPSTATRGSDAAPSFRLPNVREGAPAVSLARFSGRPVVLNFWASWCIPCAKEMPAFQSVSEQVDGRVAFVGVDHQDSRRRALELLGKTGVTYPSGYDPEGRVARSYRLRGMPTTVFISADGRVRAQRAGEMSRDELVEALRQHLGIEL